MPDPIDYVAGSSSLVMGCDGYTSPAELGDTEYVSGMNVVCRGGILQTRPGSRSLFCLPSGNFQGATLFTPDNGTAQLVAAVDGKIYVSAAPFTSYRRLQNIQFSITSKYVAWAVTLKSTDYDLEGNLITLDNPYSILIMQDGATRAAFWDGGTSGHLNPGYPADVTDVVPGYTETPIGLWMIWSGNRLWVSRGNQVFASDIGNPLKFTEGLYLNEGRAFYLSGPCTGMIELPSDSNGPKGFIAFTETNGTLFSSYIQNRTQWLNTPLFQNTIIPNVGCVAPRSLTTQYGLTWWFGPRGLANINSATRQNLTSRIDYQDNEMFSSKAYLGPDLSGICGSYYENYLVMSVPSCDVLNRHTWVLDQAPMEGNANAWTGFWSGWRPIEWARGIVNGSERVFFGSIDYDGSNRIWEAFLPEKTDNGCAITCYAQLRDHAAGNLDQKAYEWSKFFLSQIYGEVDLNIYVASTKGAYQLQKGYHLVASNGQIFSDVQYSEAGPLMIGNRVQSRTIRTPSGLEDNECNACGVESNQGNKIDYAFSHLLVWSGQMGIRAYQMHMRKGPEREAGDCEEDEVAPRTLNAAGCSGLSLLVDGQPFETFTGHAEGITQTSYGADIYIRRTATSAINQRNADAMAACSVQQIIAQLKDTDIAPGVYDSTEAEIGSGTYVVVNWGEQAEAPPAPTPIALSAGNPVISPYFPWEETAAYEPTVRFENGIFKMWYSAGWNNPAIGYATSPDGCTWTKYVSNPVVGQGGSGISGFAARGFVIKDGSTYILYYSDAVANGANTRAATSTDGINWTPYGIVVAAAVNIANGINGWANNGAWESNGTWYMLNEGHTAGGIWEICLFTGTDPYTWTLANGGVPLTSLRQAIGGMFGGSDIAHRLSSSFRVWYHAAQGVGVTPTNIYNAISSDLINWTKDITPVLAYGSQIFEVDQVADPNAIEAQGRVYLYYDGDDNANERAAIGLATCLGDLDSADSFSRLAYAAPNGATEFWNMDEASGTRVGGVNGFDLLEIGGTVNTMAGIDSTLAALTVNNTAFLAVASNPDLQLGDFDFTFNGWVNLTNASLFPAILTKYAAGQAQIFIYAEATGYRVVFYPALNGAGAVGMFATNFGGPPNNTWHMITIWHDSVNDFIGIAVDGLMQDMQAYSVGVASGGTAPLRFGSDAGAAGGGNKGLQKWGFWKRVLTDSERYFLYNAGNGVSYPF